MSKNKNSGTEAASAIVFLIICGVIVDHIIELFCVGIILFLCCYWINAKYSPGNRRRKRKINKNDDMDEHQIIQYHPVNQIPTLKPSRTITRLGWEQYTEKT